MKDTMMYCTRFCLAIVFALLLPAISSAVVTSDEAGSHVVTPGEPMFGVNLDGVVKIGFDSADSSSLEDIMPHCTGTLISDRHILTAGHCFDFDFDGQVDPILIDNPLTELEYSVVAGFELADRDVLLSVRTDNVRFPAGWPDVDIDMAIIELVEDAPADVPRYPIYALGDEVGKQIVIAGYGKAGHGATGSEDSVKAVKRAGLNRYDALRYEYIAYDFDSGLPENNGLGISGFESDLGFGVDEVMSAQGDSGGPSFINGAIACISSWSDRHNTADVNDTFDHSWGEASFNTRLSTQQYFLVAATGGQVVFVPEPTSWWLLTIGGLSLFAMRQKTALAE